MTTKKLTDRQISVLYAGFVRDYNAYKGQGYSAEEIRNRLYSNVYDSLRNKASVLHQFEDNDEEKGKIYDVLYAFLDTKEATQTTSNGGNRTIFNQRRPVYYHTTSVHYCHHDDLLYDYLLWDYSFRRRPVGYYGGYYGNGYYGGGYYGDGYYGGGGHHHSGAGHHHYSGGGGGSSSGDDLLAAFVAALLFIALAIAAGIAFIAVVHTLSEIQNNLERFIYNEGYLQAILSFANMAASFALSGTLTSFLLMAPLVAAFTFAAVSNPVGWAMTGVVLISLIAGALGYSVSNKALNYGIKKLNSDSLDPEDPCRFKLTPSEAKTLTEMGIDPIRVKCAIIELRSQMDESKDISELSIFVTRSDATKSTLDTIRKLRRGEIDEVQLSGVRFDCKKPVIREAVAEIIPAGVVVDVVQNPIQLTSSRAQPSAPPMEYETDYKQQYNKK